MKSSETLKRSAAKVEGRQQIVEKAKMEWRSAIDARAPKHNMKFHSERSPVPVGLDEDIDEPLTNSPREKRGSIYAAAAQVNGNAIELRGHGIYLGHPIISVWNPLGNCLWRRAGPRSTVKCSLLRITVARLSSRYAHGCRVTGSSSNVPIHPYKPRSRSRGSRCRRRHATCTCLFVEITRAASRAELNFCRMRECSPPLDRCALLFSD